MSELERLCATLEGIAGDIAGMARQLSQQSLQLRHAAARAAAAAHQEEGGGASAARAAAALDLAARACATAAQYLVQTGSTARAYIANTASRSGGDQSSEPDAGASSVQRSSSTMPDGRSTTIAGDPQACAAYCHLQGDGTYDGTCGIAACEQVLRQFGHQAHEKELVAYAAANGLCETRGMPWDKGGTTPADRLAILSQFGERAHLEAIAGPDHLRSLVEDGRGVILRCNAAELWEDGSDWQFGRYNHAITVTGVAFDPATGAVQGFFINDTGTGEGGRFVDVDHFRRACFDNDKHTENMAVVTDRRRPDPRRT